MSSSAILENEDFSEMTDEQCKIMKLVLTHKKARGKLTLYYQGMEEERINSLKSVMQNMNVTLSEALGILNIPATEYKKYAEVF